MRWRGVSRSHAWATAFLGFVSARADPTGATTTMPSIPLHAARVTIGLAFLSAWMLALLTTRITLEAFSSFADRDPARQKSPAAGPRAAFRAELRGHKKRPPKWLVVWHSTSTSSIQCTLLNLFLLDTARRDRQAASGRTYTHLVDSSRCILTTCLSLKLKCRCGRMDSTTRSSRRCQRDNQKYPHLLISFRYSNPDLSFPLSRASSPLVRQLRGHLDPMKKPPVGGPTE